MNLPNLRAYVVKKYLFEILQQRYEKHEPIIERVVTSLTVDKDVELFNRMILDVYDIAYQKCVSDHREQLSKIGVEVKIVASS